METAGGWALFRSRPFFFPAFAFVLGTAVGARLTGPPLLPLALAVVVLTWALYRQARWGAHLLLLLSCFLAGGALSIKEARETPPSPRQVRLEGVIERIDTFSHGPRLTLAVALLDGRPAAFRTQLYPVGNLPRLLVGQRIHVPVRWAPLVPPANPGEPDRSRHRLRQGIAYTGSFDARALVVLTAPSGLWAWLEKQHASLRRIAHATAPSPEAAALYLTLSAGLRADLGPALEEEFSASGLAHLLSVSGLHVAVLAFVLVWLLRAGLLRGWPGARRVDVRRVAAPLGIPLVWAYVLYTGSQGPAVRSAWMVSLVLFGLALWKTADGLNTLSVSAVVVLTFSPSSVGELSMQLSFLAVLSLLLLTPPLRRLFPPRLSVDDSNVRYWAGRLQEAVTSTLCASLAVTLGCAPLVAGTFGRVSVAGLFSNVVCMPLSAFLTAVAAAGAFFHTLWPPLAFPFVFLGTHASGWMLSLSHAFAQVPGAVWRIQDVGAGLAGVYWLGLLLFVLARGRLRLGALLTPAVMALALVPPSMFRDPSTEVVFLSVGQGDAIVVHSSGHSALIDAGGVPQGADVGQRFVLPYLRQRGIDSLELAVLSHPHPDHALGLVSTLREISTRRLWVSKGAPEGPLTEAVVTAAHRGSDADAPVVVEEVEQGRAPFRLGEVTIDVLWPPRDRALLEGVNDLSVVLKLTHRNVTFLLTGDIEEAAEQSLAPGAVTVLKAPHHGSRTSSTPAFLERLRPRFAVFCVGRNNRFRFPHPEVVARYESAQARCYRTDVHGAVSFKSDGEDVHVTTFHTPDETVDAAKADAQFSRR